MEEKNNFEEKIPHLKKNNKSKKINKLIPSNRDNFLEKQSTSATLGGSYDEIIP